MLCLVAAAVAVAWVTGDDRVFRPPVFMAVLGLAGGAGAFAGAWRGWQASDPRAPGVLLCAGALALAAWQVSDLSTASADYRLYEGGAREWVAGSSPYAVQGHNQLPVPLVALGSARVALGALAPGATDASLWQATYYAYELIQLLSVVVIIAGLYALARRAGAEPSRAAILAGILATFALPIKESIGNNQFNIPVLALAIAAMVTIERYPAAAGVCVALAGLLKLYPLVFLLEWVIARRWRALAACALTMVVLVAGTWTHWMDYGATLAGLPPMEAFRHAGLHAIIVNTTRAVMLGLGGSETWRSVAVAVWALSCLAVGAWMVRITLADRAQPHTDRRPFDVMSRLLAAVILVFPLAWAHHFIFAAPLALCLCARKSPSTLVMAATALTLMVPAFDVYPLALHRLIGLVLLLAA
jgi:alpha-1,2-mannosyltransferase